MRPDFSKLLRDCKVRVGPPSLTMHAPTGDVHHTYAQIADTEDEALELLQGALLMGPLDGLGEWTHTAYWRKVPTVERHNSGGFCATCRVAVSAKPMLPEHIAMEAAAHRVTPELYCAMVAIP